MQSLIFQFNQVTHKLHAYTLTKIVETKTDHWDLKLTT